MHSKLEWHRIVRVISAFINCWAILFITACSSLSEHNTDFVQSQLEEQYQLWKGTHYQIGGLSKTGIDCSGFVYLTFLKQFNIKLPRATRHQINTGVDISRHSIQPGDLLFFKTGEKIRHVGIYAGDNYFLHASTSKGVIYSSLDNSYWANSYWKAKRVSPYLNRQ
jgi:cell wall-associated NlpC family hydrolase